MSNDEIPREALQESILERLSASLQGVSLESEARREDPDELGSDIATTSEGSGSDSATTSEGSGSAAWNDSTSNTRFNSVLDYFYRTFCDYFDSMPVFERVGADIGHFVLACRFVTSRAQPLFPDFPDLPDSMEEVVSELRTLGLDMYLEYERAKGLKAKCFRYMDTIKQAYRDGEFSSDEPTNTTKNLLDDTSTVMSLINVILRENRLRIQYFYALRGLILSHFCQN